MCISLSAKNACYCLFSTDLNKIFHIKDVDKIIKTPCVLNTVLLSDVHSCVY